MAAPRTFAALIDQDSVVLLEYRQEKAGFRVVDTRSESRRSATPEAACELVIRMVEDMGARAAALSIVLQHFGSFFHALVLPAATDEVVRPIVLREVQRSFNITDPAVAWIAGPAVERRDAPRDGGAVVPRQILIAGAPKSVVSAFQACLGKSRLTVEGMTVIPEVMRRLYDALDGSTEATALLICLGNGPHLGFFVGGRLELAIEPSLAVEGEPPLDAGMIVDQLERGAIFLRQQARGAVATRLLLSAPNSEYEHLASTIEGRTGMRVAPLGRAIGSPETVVAMGAVLAARENERLDLFPRAPTMEQQVRSAIKGPAAVTTAVSALTFVALVWALFQFVGLLRDRQTLLRLQADVNRAVPAVVAMRQSAQGRERVAGLRKALSSARDDRRLIGELLASLASSTPPGAKLDSFNIQRTQEGLKTTVFGRANGTSGSAAVSAASTMFHYLQRHDPKVKKLDLQLGAMDTTRAGSPVKTVDGSQLNFVLSFVAPLATGGP